MFYMGPQAVAGQVVRQVQFSCLSFSGQSFSFSFIAQPLVESLLARLLEDSHPACPLVDSLPAFLLVDSRPACPLEVLSS